MWLQRYDKAVQMAGDAYTQLHAGMSGRCKYVLRVSGGYNIHDYCTVMHYFL